MNPARDDDLEFKVLASVKWHGKHFHVLCDGGSCGTQTRLIIQTHLFPEDAPYLSGVHMVEYICRGKALKRVDGDEYRYLCMILVDLDGGQGRT